jgi:uncharacterized protein YkwD
MRTPTIYRSKCLSLLLAGALAACGGGDDEGRTDVAANLMLTPEGRVVLDATTSCGLPDFQASLLAQINAARAQERSCGSKLMPAVAPLVWNTRLFSAAAKHSADMAAYNYFSHTGRNGSTPGQRITAEGYEWSAAGENIAAGQTSVSSVMAGWLASPGHCENLMRSQYREVGVACVVAPVGATYSRYWGMKLSAPR